MSKIEFLSTPSARRATRRGRKQPQRGAISIHALREEGDGARRIRRGRLHHFYPRPPRGGRLERVTLQLISAIFLSTPSARRATRKARATSTPLFNFYPRPPRGGRLTFDTVELENFVFLSTPSARRATYQTAILYGSSKFLSTPSARRATLNLSEYVDESWQFLSTPSARRATASRLRPVRNGQISIHALREEGDARKRSPRWTLSYFYPRPPRGGRLYIEAEKAGTEAFLSTPSARRATRQRNQGHCHG